MTIYKASKTLDAIEQAISKDQGAAYRGYLGKVIPHIGDAYSTSEEPFRGHLGASIIGKECRREIWYSYRWFRKPSFSGRILRLFNRGHLEEARFIAILLTIGCEVFQQDADGNQYRISSSGGHFSGSLDSVIKGIPDLPEGLPCLGEFKTHNDASFRKLVANGVKKSKPEHYVQMQIYMRKMNLSVALYLAVDKNDDDIWAELVPLDSEFADAHLEVADAIIYRNNPPARISESPGFWKCKFCDYKAICHLGDIPAMNCRTCLFSTPQENGTWLCKKHGHILSKKEQLDGCNDHEHKT